LILSKPKKIKRQPRRNLQLRKKQPRKPLLLRKKRLKKKPLPRRKLRRRLLKMPPRLLPRLKKITVSLLPLHQRPMPLQQRKSNQRPQRRRFLSQYLTLNLTESISI